MNLKLLELLLLGSIACAESVPNFEEYGAACTYLSSDESLQSKITLHISLAKDVAVPYLIFPYQSLLTFSKVPTWEYYFSKYLDSHSRSQLYEEVLKDGEFDVESLFGESYGDLSAWKGKLENKGTEEGWAGDLNQEVANPGTYCIYIAPPPETTVELEVKHNHGYLAYPKYLNYCVEMIAFPILIAIFGYLLYYTTQFRLTFTNIKSLSLISKAMIFYMLAPFIVVRFIILMTQFARNDVANGYNLIFDAMDFATDWLCSMILVSRDLFILLLAMGYGVIYDLRANRNYRKMPRKNIFIAALLFASNAISISLNYLHWKPNTFSLLNENLHGVVFRRFNQWFQLVWYITTIIFYFNTKRILRDFPPVMMEEETANEENNKIMTSFNRSILLVFITPFFVLLFYFGFALRNLLFNQDLAHLAMHPAREEVIQSVKSALNAESLLPTWPIFASGSYLITFVSIGLIFILWVKDYNMTKTLRKILKNEKAI